MRENLVCKGKRVHPKHSHSFSLDRYGASDDTSVYHTAPIPKCFHKGYTGYSTPPFATSLSSHFTPLITEPVCHAEPVSPVVPPERFPRVGSLDWMIFECDHVHPLHAMTDGEEHRFERARRVAEEKSKVDSINSTLDSGPGSLLGGLLESGFECWGWVESTWRDIWRAILFRGSYIDEEVTFGQRIGVDYYCFLLKIVLIPIFIFILFQRKSSLNLLVFTAI